MNRRTFLQFTGGLTLITTSHPLALASNPPWIEIQVWSSQGTPLDAKKLDQLYFLSLQDEPLPDLPRRVEEGKLYSQAPPLPFAIALKMLVTGFGEVTLYCDNQGIGYSVTDFPLNLNLAFAQSRLYRVKKAVQLWQAQGISLPPGTITRLEKAQAYLAPSPSLEQMRLSLVESLWAGEEAVGPP